MEIYLNDELYSRQIGAIQSDALLYPLPGRASGHVGDLDAHRLQLIPDAVSFGKILCLFGLAPCQHQSIDCRVPFAGDGIAAGGLGLLSIRISMLAQSWLSVPPAPELILSLIHISTPIWTTTERQPAKRACNSFSTKSRR